MVPTLIFFLMVMNDLLPTCVLHEKYRVPGPWQMYPNSQDLLCVATPPPQVLEQELGADHSLQGPNSGLPSLSVM